MNLICPQLNTTFQFKPHMLNRIVIEHPEYYERVVLALYSQIQGKEESLTCYLHDEIYSISKYFDLILSPMDLVYNKKDVQKKLYQYLIGELELQELSEKIAQNYGLSLELLETMAIFSDYPIVFREEFDLTDWLKQMDVQIKQPEGRFIERLLEYGTTVNRLLGKQTFVLANCDAYLTLDDYLHLQQWIQYENIYIVLLDQQQSALNLPINEIIIDMDLCEIR